MPSSPPLCLIITGPTASGKTQLAFALAHAMKGTIINADSMQLYDHLSLLTARPSNLEKSSSIPYFLDGVLSGQQKASTGWWLEKAVTYIKDTWGLGRLPIVVGGTGLYLKSLMEGLSPIPDIPHDIHLRVRQLREEPLERLKAAFSFPHSTAYTDPQRFLRAYEVFLTTGHPIQDFYAIKKPPLTCGFLTVALLPERQTLYARIDTRFQQMMKEGATEEVKALLTQNLPMDHPILKATGVQAIKGYLEDAVSYEEALVLGQQHTRQYAKRQMTWIRNQIKSDLVMDAVELKEQLEIIGAALV